MKALAIFWWWRFFCEAGGRAGRAKLAIAPRHGPATVGTMKSMTGFGRGEATGPAGRCSVELSSVNRKQADIDLRMPRDWQPLEAGVRQMLAGALSRGRLHGVIGYETDAAATPALRVDDSLAKEYAAHLTQLGSRAGNAHGADSRGPAASAGRLYDVGTASPPVPRSWNRWSICGSRRPDRMGRSPHPRRRASPRRPDSPPRYPALTSWHKSPTKRPKSPRCTAPPCTAASRKPACPCRWMMSACSKKSPCSLTNATSPRKSPASAATSPNSSASWKATPRRAARSISSPRKCTANSTPWEPKPTTPRSNTCVVAGKTEVERLREQVQNVE